MDRGGRSVGAHLLRAALGAFAFKSIIPAAEACEQLIGSIQEVSPELTRERLLAVAQAQTVSTETTLTWILQHEHGPVDAVERLEGRE